jgi:hypothetical protein
MAEPLPQEWIDALLSDSGNFQVKRGFEDLSRQPGAPSERVEEAFDALPNFAETYVYDLVPEPYGPMMGARAAEALNPLVLATRPEGVEAFRQSGPMSMNVDDRRNDTIQDELGRLLNFWYKSRREGWPGEEENAGEKMMMQQGGYQTLPDLKWPY